MSNETTITIVGNLTGDPELSYTSTGDALVRFSIASTPRRYDRATGEWIDGETLFLRCTAWRDLAEHIAETLHKGHRVIATGRLKATSWQTDTGERRSSIDLDIDEIGPSLRFATARVIKMARATTEGGASSGASVPSQPTPPAGQPAPAGASTSGDRGGDRPPF